MTKFITLNCYISRTSWHMKVSDDFFLLDFSCSFIRAQLVLIRESPFKGDIATIFIKLPHKMALGKSLPDL